MTTAVRRRSPWYGTGPPPRDRDEVLRLLATLLDEASELRENEGAPNPLLSTSELISQARRIMINRQRRTRRFGKPMFGEPAWDMLLLLYASDARYTASRLAVESAAPRSTAMRWIDYLERQGLVAREPHPTDKRLAYITLTPKGRADLDAYMCETIKP